jgi:hypothetical protein
VLHLVGIFDFFLMNRGCKWMNKTEKVQAILDKYGWDLRIGAIMVLGSFNPEGKAVIKVITSQLRGKNKKLKHPQKRPYKNV